MTGDERNAVMSCSEMLCGGTRDGRTLVLWYSGGISAEVRLGSMRELGSLVICFGDVSASLGAFERFIES